MNQYNQITKGETNSTIQKTYEEYLALMNSISAGRRKAAATAKAIQNGVDALTEFILQELGK